MLKSKNDNQLKTFVCSEVFTQLQKFRCRISEDSGRKVSIAQAVRWVLESFFGVSILEARHYPKDAKNRSLVGPEKDLADALDKIDELSTELRVEREKVAEYEGQIKSATREILEALKLDAKCFLSNATDMIINVLHERDKTIDMLQHEQKQSYEFGGKILEELGLSVSEDSQLSFDRCVEVIGSLKKDAHESKGSCEFFLTVIKSVSEKLGRNGATLMELETEDKQRSFVEDLYLRVTSKNIAVKDMNNRMEAILDATALEGSQRVIGNVPAYIEGWKKEVKSVEEQRDQFEKYWHGETDSNNRLLDKLRLWKGEFEDWMSVLSVEQNHGFLRKILKAFGVSDRITDADRKWAEDEVKRIGNYIDKTVEPHKEETEQDEQ